MFLQQASYTPSFGGLGLSRLPSATVGELTVPTGTLILTGGNPFLIDRTMRRENPPAWNRISENEGGVQIDGARAPSNVSKVATQPGGCGASGRLFSSSVGIVLGILLSASRRSGYLLWQFPDLLDGFGQLAQQVQD